MTPIVLLKELKKLLDDTLKDLVLPTKDGTERQPQIVFGNLPPKDPQSKDDRLRNQFPFIILRVLTGKDYDEASSECTVRLIFGTYNSSNNHGYIDLLNIIQRVRLKLLKNRVVGNQFEIKLEKNNPLEYFIYEDQPEPHYMGEIMTTWTIPNITRELGALPWDSL